MDYNPDASRFYVPTVPTFMTVTPEIAAVWQTRHFAMERKVSGFTVKRYENTLRRGEWKLTHEGFAFTSALEMIDGWHRAGAIVRAGKPMEALVVPGLPPESFAFMNIGYKRQAGQFMGKYGNTKAAACRILAALSGEYEDFQNNPVYCNTIEPYHLEDVANHWPELDLYVADVLRLRYRHSIYINSPAHLAVLAQAECTKYAKDIPAWLNALETGLNFKAGDPRYFLREAYRQDSAELNSSRNRVRVYTMIVKAWNAFVLKQKIQEAKELEPVKGEAIPGVAGFSWDRWLDAR